MMKTGILSRMLKNSIDFTIGFTKTLAYCGLALAPKIAAALFNDLNLIKISTAGFGALSVLKGFLGLQKSLEDKKVQIPPINSWPNIAKNVADIAIGTLMIARPLTSHPIVDISINAYSIAHGIYSLIEGSNHLREILLKSNPDKWEKAGAAAANISLGIFTAAAFKDQAIKHYSLIKLKEYLPEESYFNLYEFFVKSCENSRQVLCQNLINKCFEENQYSLLADIYRIKDGNSEPLFKNLREFASSFQIVELYKKNADPTKSFIESMTNVFGVLSKIMEQHKYTLKEYHFLDKMLFNIQEFAVMHGHFNELNPHPRLKLFDFLNCTSPEKCSLTQKLISESPALIPKIYLLGRISEESTPWFSSMNAFQKFWSFREIEKKIDVLIPYSKCYSYSLITKIQDSIEDIQKLSLDRCYSHDEIILAKKYLSLHLLGKGKSELSAVIIEAKDYHNTYPKSFSTGIQKIYRLHKKLFSAFADNLNDVCKALKRSKEINKEVPQVVVITDHPQTNTFTNLKLFEIVQNSLPSECVENISQNATVILLKSNAGKSSMLFSNSARWYSRQLVGRTIFAPDDELSTWSFDYKINDGVPTTRFTSYNARDMTIVIKHPSLYPIVQPILNHIGNVLTSSFQYAWKLCTNTELP